MVNIKPFVVRTPAEIPVHLRKAADAEIQSLLKAGVIKECHEKTDWVSRGLFIPKKSKEGDESVALRGLRPVKQGTF